MNGAVVNVRSKGDKLAIWVTDSANTEAVVSECPLDVFHKSISQGCDFEGYCPPKLQRRGACILSKMVTMERV